VYQLNLINKNLDKKQVIEISFLSLPLILFFSSGLINFYVIYIIFFSFFFFKIKIKSLQAEDKLLLLFFVSIIISSLINKYDKLNVIDTYYSITLLRFFFLYLFFRILFLKISSYLVCIFFCFCLFLSFFLSIDIFIQHILGYDLLGFESFNERYNGFFEHEAVAGSYIFKFLIFSICAIFLLKFLNKYYLNIIILAICISGILYSFDRSPYILSLVLLLCFFFFIKERRNFFLPTIIIICIIFFLSFQNYLPLKKRYQVLISQLTTNFEKTLIEKKININNRENPVTSKINIDQKKILFEDYGNIFYSSYLVIKKKLIIGHGHKNYLINCLKLDDQEFTRLTKTCSNHPHNIYLEILISGGVISAFFFLFFLIKIFNKLVKNLFVKKINFLFLIFLTVEFFPLKSSGSILSTFNGTIFFSSLGIIIGLISRKNLTFPKKFNSIS